MRTVLIVSAFAFLGFAAPALAEGDPDAAKGLITEHCVDCHEVPGYSGEDVSPVVNAPAFAAIAGKPETYTPERLRAFLGQPHWPMGRFVLSKRDIDNLIAFIESLESR